MGTTPSHLALIAVWLIAMPLCAAARAPQEPYSGSRPLGFWVEALASPVPQARIDAAEAIADMALRQGGSVVVTAVSRLVENLQAHDPSLRRSAARALEQIGPPAAAGLPALLRMYGHDPEPPGRRSAALAIARIDASSPEAVGLAAQGLRDADAGVRVGSGVVLMAAGAASAAFPAALEALDAALQDADPLVRIYAAAAIGRAGAPDRAAPLLMDGLRSPDMVVRAESAGLLVDLAPRRPPVIGALAAALKDPEAQVRTAVADALGAIGRPARPALDALWGLKRDPDADVRESVIRAATAIRN